MSRAPEANPHHVSPWKFVVALVVVVGLVALVSPLLEKKSARDYATRYDEPKGMGHAVPGPKEPQTSSAPVNPHDHSWTNGMKWIPGGTFQMGSEEGQPDEKPVHEVTVDGFWLDTYELTNEEFERFVKATGYVTIAERKPKQEDFPTAPPEALVPGSIVFTPPPGEVPLPYVEKAEGAAVAVNSPAWNGAAWPESGECPPPAPFAPNGRSALRSSCPPPSSGRPVRR